MIMQMLLLSLLFVAFLLMNVVSGEYGSFSMFELPQGVIGPESASFCGLPFLSEGPYTTVTDGRILKWQGPNAGFVDFAYTSPARIKQVCDGTTDPNMGPMCGRPLGLSFNSITGLLYIVDAYFGLLVVGPDGGLATQLAGGFKFVGGLDVDLFTGNVYFIDASLNYEIRNITQPEFQTDSTGRLLRYNPLKRSVSVLLTGLWGGGGPAVSHDGTFVLVPEFGGRRISKYWLAGPKANTAELLLNTTGDPNKIKRAGMFGEYWVALSIGFTPPEPLITPLGMRFSSDGVVLETVSFATQFFNKTITLVQENNGKLYVGSRLTNFIVYSN